jgi:O-methyltransferase
MASDDDRTPILPAGAYSDRALKFGQRFHKVYEAITFPLTVYALLNDRQIRAEYGLSWIKKFRLAYRMYRNCREPFAATPYQAHLIMALKLFQIPPEVRGVVVECGTFKGVSAANLSLVCAIVGRELIIYDSFEGLPEPEANDRYAEPSFAGWFRGELDEVKANIARMGAIDRCTFRKGWFKDTLPDHTEPVVACFIDVDYQSSLVDCITNLWPHLTTHGYVFMDEYTRLDYCALFYSERFWKQYFDTTPPGLLGIGSGVPVGNYFVGPYWTQPPQQYPISLAYTRKDFNGYWDFYPEGGDEAAG